MEQHGAAHGARADDDGRETEGETKSGETQRGRESGEAPARKMTAEHTSRGQFEEPQNSDIGLEGPNESLTHHGEQPKIKRLLVAADESPRDG